MMLEGKYIRSVQFNDDGGREGRERPIIDKAKAKRGGGCERATLWSNNKTMETRITHQEINCTFYNGLESVYGQAVGRGLGQEWLGLILWSTRQSTLRRDYY